MSKPSSARRDRARAAGTLVSPAISMTGDMRHTLGVLANRLGVAPTRVSVTMIGWRVSTDPDLVIDVSSASVVRGGKDLIRDVDWRVELDERWVVLGPNGAGKTTLLDLAAARLHPTTGTVARARRAARPGRRHRAAYPDRPVHRRAARPDPAGRDRPRRRRDGVLVGGRPVPRGVRRRRTYAGPRALLGQLGAGALADRATARCPRASASGYRSPGR